MEKILLVIKGEKSLKINSSQWYTWQADISLCSDVYGTKGDLVILLFDE